MGKEKQLDRDTIIRSLTSTLEPLDYVHAFYEGGAISFNRLDEWSDIDLYLIVDDEKVDDAFRIVEKILESMSPIKQKYAVPQTQWEGVSQAFYRLKNASEYLLIDLAVLTPDTPEKFLESNVHGAAVFYFNKSNKIRPPELDKEELISKLRIRVKRLQTRFSMFNIFVQKEINRGNSVEALDLYYNVTLGMLVEALRIKHYPYHYDFRTRYIQYELPKETVQKLTDLYFVKDLKDLQEKHNTASKWLQKAIKIKPEEIERSVEAP